MLETVREYGLERLATLGEGEAIRHRHAAFFLALTERVVPDIPLFESISPWFGMLETEHPNLREALAWLAGCADAEPLLRLATRLWLFWYLKGHFREGRRWLEQAASRSDEASGSLRAKAFLGAGQLAHYQGDDERAATLLGEALVQSRRVPGSWVTAHALLVLGIVEEDQGQYERAESLLWEALVLYRELGDQAQMALITGHLGVVAYGKGDLARSIAVLQEARAMAQAAGNAFSAEFAGRYLGLIACERGDPAPAAARFMESLAFVEAYDDPEGLAQVLACCGVLDTRFGEAERAAQMLGAAQAMRQRIGAIVGLPERAAYERAGAAACAALGDEAFTAAWAAGRALSREEAVALTRESAAAAMSFSPPTARYAADSPHGLTPRELEVLRLVAQGRSNREIAATLFVSVPTVKRHLSTILGKLDLPSRSAATAFAHTHDLV
jgi:non-specific serine/threonine protein kinase